MYFGFDAVTVGYNRRAEPVVRDLTLALRAGEITALVGPNGCGKSTLLSLVPRLHKPWAGRVICCGAPLAALSPKEAARKIAYLPQHHEAPGDLSVRTLVSYGRYPHPSNAALDRAIVEDALTRTGLTALADRPLSTPSCGERQRAWIAMAVAQQPEILLLDEPTTYLDVGHQIEVLELISALRAEMGLTVLMVLHDLNLAARYADRLCVMQAGALVADGPPAAVLTADMLRQVFGVEADVHDDAGGCPYLIPRRKEGGQ